MRNILGHACIVAIGSAFKVDITINRFTDNNDLHLPYLVVLAYKHINPTKRKKGKI